VIVNGVKIASRIERRISREIAEAGAEPNLAVVMAGSDPASEVYVGKKRTAAERAGIGFDLHHFLADVPEEKVYELLDRLNADPDVHGIIIQLPLPDHLETDALVNYVAPWKDVDGLGGAAEFLSPAAGAVLEILKNGKVPIKGKHAVVVGAGRVAGLPIASVLVQEGATVTVCQIHTQDLKSHTKSADILVSAAGKPGLISRSHVKKGAAVIDVGITRNGGRIRGDADPAAAEKAGLFTPVPGGVGPITVAKLLENTLTAYQNRDIG